MSEQATLLQQEWKTSPRWAGITRDYSAQDVIRLRDVAPGEHSAARDAAGQLWDLLHAADAVQAPSAPPVAEADGPDDSYGQLTAMLAAGAAGGYFTDQLSPQDGRGPVLIPTGQHIETLTAARLAADVLGVPAVLIAQTAAHQAAALTVAADERDREFLTGERTADGLYGVRPSLYSAVTRALAFAPYADLLCLATPEPDLAGARAFAAVIHSQYPDKRLAYRCVPPARLDAPDAARFQRELSAMGYRFQSLTPAAELADARS